MLYGSMRAICDFCPMRTLAIGDIHGGARALEQLLDRVGLRADDRLVFLGDYVDGWSDAVRTVNLLLQLRSSHDCIFIRGNHDALCADWLKHQAHNPLWEQHGGAATKHAYEGQDRELINIHLGFYEGLEDFHLDEKTGRLFVHAGFTNLKGVDHEYFKGAYYWDRTLWELALSVDPNLAPGDTAYPPRLQLYSEIFIGHTPVTRIGKIKPHKASCVWNVDTGAAFRGPLSAIDVETKEVWQSDPVHVLYPGETGRN